MLNGMTICYDLFNENQEKFKSGTILKPLIEGFSNMELFSKLSQVTFSQKWNYSETLNRRVFKSRTILKLS